MKNKKTSALLPFIFLFLSGCSHYSVSTEKLSELSETDLCIALGERNNTGSEVLRITEEIEKRGDKISSENVTYSLTKPCVHLQTLPLNPMPNVNITRQSMTIRKDAGSQNPIPMKPD